MEFGISSIRIKLTLSVDWTFQVSCFLFFDGFLRSWVGLLFERFDHWVCLSQAQTQIQIPNTKGIDDQLEEKIKKKWPEKKKIQILIQN